MPRSLTYPLALMALGATPAAAQGRPVEGRWLTDDGKGVVTIVRCGGSVCGRISTVLDSGPQVPKTDIKNPDPRLRSRPIVGIAVLYGFRFERGKWIRGTAYDPQSGNSYRASLEVDGTGSLKVTGCVLLICRSKRWKRLPGPAWPAGPEAGAKMRLRGGAVSLMRTGLRFADSNPAREM